MDENEKKGFDAGKSDKVTGSDWFGLTQQTVCGTNYNPPSNSAGKVSYDKGYVEGGGTLPNK